jgi:hypothetical protein
MQSTQNIFDRISRVCCIVFFFFLCCQQCRIFVACYIAYKYTRGAAVCNVQVTGLYHKIVWYAFIINAIFDPDFFR